MTKPAPTAAVVRQRTHLRALPGDDTELSEAERDMLAVATAFGVTR